MTAQPTLRRLLDDYAVLSSRLMPTTCREPDCTAPAVSDGHHSLCTAGHLIGSGDRLASTNRSRELGTFLVMQELERWAAEDEARIKDE